MNNYEILKNLPSDILAPRQFLRYCFGFNKLTLEEILDEEISFGYSVRCVNLLSKILGIQKKTVRGWGDNPNFEGMPQHARKTCSYAQIALSPEVLKKIASLDYTAPRLTAMQFMEETLLKGLSPCERLKLVSSTNFRGQYLTLLSETLTISKRTIYEWGRDIELPLMPKYHQHTLAYALAAYGKKEQTSIAA
ncbi:hypothetical protein [Rivularia sp. UHCC 0363]|uniref:hypothetical protein n=1 Tax=Rivularia sp. UHCC 0363 TaxID=3110244 RepID=UPI002B1F9911|nr:hypothetical protein [Rivularia sp. UHCC 0363]MEA5599053.1 hypothetical protein [Rivularia sp. UHCC 0363]